ncbi:MAG: prepilin peptidase [Rubrobacteraceae bacterium]
MIPAISVLFGLVVGSFLNVVIHRVPLGESVVRPSSYCPNCGAGIRPYDNVPLLSYLALRGRCRDCKARIPARIPVVEGSTGLLFGAAAYQFGPDLRLAAAMVFIAALISLAGTDLEHRLLPNRIIVPATLAGLVLSILINPGQWWIYPTSMLGVGGLLFALALVYPGGMGMGDVKMGGMLGAFLGPYAALAVFTGALAGAGIGGVLIGNGKMRRQTPLPFGAFMAFGGGLSLFWGPDLWETYLDAIGGI